MMNALFQFEVKFDIAESYLYGKAIGDRGAFAINLQGGRQHLVLPRDLLAGLPYVNEARLHIRTDSEEANITVDVKLSAGNDMIEIYDDELLQKLANCGDVALQVEIK